MIVAGVDVSLTATGWAVLHPPCSSLVKGTVKVPGRGLERMRGIRYGLLESLGSQDSCEIVAIEGLSYGNHNGKATERAGLWWMIVDDLRSRVKVIAVPPTTLKKFATGKGHADKVAMVLALARIRPDFDGTHDEADATWLAMFAAQYVGYPVAPAVQYRLDCMEAVEEISV